MKKEEIHIQCAVNHGQQPRLSSNLDVTLFFFHFPSNQTAPEMYRNDFLPVFLSKKKKTPKVYLRFSTI